MIGVKSVRFSSDHRCFKQGTEIIFRQGINLLVGDQGCGKTTLLDMMNKQHGDLDVDLHPYTRINSTKTVYFDTEKMNPRIVNALPHDATAEEFRTNLALRWSSHGEAMLPILMSQLRSFNGIIFIDEPESGLSIRSQYKLASAIMESEKRGAQLFIATHSIVLMESVHEVYSMEHMRWMTSEEFIQTQKA